MRKIFKKCQVVLILTLCAFLSFQTNAADNEGIQESVEHDAVQEPSELPAESGRIILMGIPAADTVQLVTGERIDYPVTLGSYSTNYFTINGSVAYCLESDKETPISSEYAASLIDNELILKGLYYGMGGPGELEIFKQSQINDLSAYILTHIALSYFYSGSNAFTGCTEEGLREFGVMSVIDRIRDAPPVPKTGLSISPRSSETAVEGDIQKSSVISVNGDKSNSISFALPEEVSFHDLGTGEQQTGGSVTIPGNTSFYLSAPTDYAGIFRSGSMLGTLRNTWKALVIRTGDTTQALGSLAYTAEQEEPVSFDVTFRKNITFHKRNSGNGSAVEDALLQILDPKGNLVYEFISAKGPTVLTLAAGDYILHEERAPNGYLAANDVPFTVSADGSSQSVSMENDFIKVRIKKCDSDGMVLRGAFMKLFDSKGRLVKEWISGRDAEPFDRLEPGKYLIHEETAPNGYAVAEDMEISVEATSKEQIFTMKDAKLRTDAPDTPPTDTRQLKAAFAPVTGDRSMAESVRAILSLLTGGAIVILLARKRFV